MASVNNPELVFAVVPRVAAAFSLLGSSFIVAEVCRDRRKRSRVYHRIVAGMSVFDIVGSICYFLGRWPLPPDAEFLPGGVGNQQTCTAQAFFGQAVVATVTYNTTLAVQYLMIITFGISEKQIERKYEKFMHAIPILVWLTTGALGIAFEVFNPAFFNCWIAPVPINCAAAGEPVTDGRPECTRGYLAPIFQWAIFYAPIWAMIAIVTGIMLKVYCGVRKTERRNSLYASASGDAKAQMRHSRRVAKQGLWYLLPFYATWIFPVATEITEMVTGNYYDPMVVLVSFFLPFQGALNFMVYMRPRFLKYRRDNPEWSLPVLMYRTLKKSLCCTKNGEEDDFVTEGPERRGSVKSSFDVVVAKFARRRSSSFDNNDRRSTFETDNDAPAVRVVSSLIQGEMGAAIDEDVGNSSTHDARIAKGDEEELEKDFSYRDMWVDEADEAEGNDDTKATGSDKMEEDGDKEEMAKDFSYRDMWAMDEEEA